MPDTTPTTRRPRWLRLPAVTAAVLLLAALALTSGSGYASLTPAEPRRLIASPGRLDAVAIDLEPVTALQLAWAVLTGRGDTLHRADFLTGDDLDHARARSQGQMTAAYYNSYAAAARLLAHATAGNCGVLVTEDTAGLRAGDIIVGRSIAELADQQVVPVTRDPAALTCTSLVAAQQRTLTGVPDQDKATDIPDVPELAEAAQQHWGSDDIAASLDQVGGPSAGLAWTLTWLARTHPDLLAGLHVAATGTIDADGTVGKVGGVDLKYASDPDVDVFLMPIQDQPGLGTNVVQVLTADEAVTALCRAPGRTAHCGNWARLR